MKGLLRILWAFAATRFRRFRDREALGVWQERRLQALLGRVLPRSPYYRRRLEALGAEGHWRDLKPMEKVDMMAAFSDLNTVGLEREEAYTLALEGERSRDFSPTWHGVTVGLSSGTSGHRGLFLASEAERWRYVGTLLAKLLPGSFFQRHRVAFFMRASSNLYSAAQSRWLQFEFFDLLEPMERHLARLKILDPTLLVGPPSVLRFLAQEAVELRPSKVISIAEVLDPLDEALLEARFQQRIHQVYQCTEGFLGITCAHGTLHLNEDLVIIEKEWVDRPNRRFVPIITDFCRETQPILRYRLNDLLTERAEPCPCGSTFTALEQIEGRCDDILYFRAREGAGWVAVFPDLIRRALLLTSDRIRDYRVVQAELGALEIALDAPAENLEGIQARIGEELVDLSGRLGALSPALGFSETFEPLGSRKLRRVERRCSEPAPADQGHRNPLQQEAEQGPASPAAQGEAR